MSEPDSANLTVVDDISPNKHAGSLSRLGDDGTSGEHPSQGCGTERWHVGR